MKRLEKLTEVQQEILKTLEPGQSNAKSLKEIQEYIGEEEVEVSISNLKKNVSELIKYGAVRGFVEEDGRKYALARGFGSGYRNQGSLLGRTNPVRDAYRMVKRLFGGIFVLAGLGIFIYQNTSISGAVVAEAIGNQTAPLLSSLLLIVTGGFLLFQSFKTR